MEWISIKDRLPEKDIPVLCFDGTYINIMEYWYDEKDESVFFNPPSPLKNNITHWMPLPSPPEKE